MEFKPYKDNEYLENSYYRTNKKNWKFFFNLFSPDLSFRLKGEKLKGQAIVAFYIIGKHNFPIIEQIRKIGNFSLICSRPI